MIICLATVSCFTTRTVQDFCPDRTEGKFTSITDSDFRTIQKILLANYNKQNSTKVKIGGYNSTEFQLRESSTSNRVVVDQKGEVVQETSRSKEENTILTCTKGEITSVREVGGVKYINVSFTIKEQDSNRVYKVSQAFIRSGNNVYYYLLTNSNPIKTDPKIRLLFTEGVRDNLTETIGKSIDAF